MSILIARTAAFTKAGRYVEKGQTVSSDEVDYNADDEKSAFIEAPEGFNSGAVVEISAIAPTGPNPQNPQQVAPDVRQTVSGYEQAGARLVGEVTKPEAVRFEIISDANDTTQADVTEALENADQKDANVSNEGTEGTVKDVATRVETMDAAALDQLFAAENDREQPRKGVLSAIEARRAALTA